MSETHCPHCGAAIRAMASYCVECGKALPSAAVGPRIVDEAGLAGTRLGQNMQSEELAKQTKKVYKTLLVVAILQMIFGTLLVVMAFASNGGEGVQAGDVARVIMVVYGVAALFFGLAYWAKSNPLPAAIVGLVLFVTLHVVDALFDPTALLKGIIVKVIIVVVLVRAISAGAKHRALMRQMGQA